MGPTTLPCGTPVSVFLKVVISSVNFRYDSNVLQYAWGRIFLILNKRPGLHTSSDACVISRNTAEHTGFFKSSSYYIYYLVYLFYGRVFLSKSKLMVQDHSVFFLYQV
jgi:hypothetical protein